MERLSTSKRINSASDNAAGVAISSRLTAEIRGANEAIRNVLDAQTLIDTAESNHKEIENVLQLSRKIGGKRLTILMVKMIMLICRQSLII